MENSDGHVESEEVEGFLVGIADAGLSPNAMMVQLVDAFSTGAAVRHSWHLHEIAVLALLHCQITVGIMSSHRHL